MWNEDDIDRYNREQIKDYKDKLKLLRKLENNCEIKEPIINNGYPNICPNEFDCLRRETMNKSKSLQFLRECQEKINNMTEEEIESIREAWNEMNDPINCIQQSINNLTLSIIESSNDSKRFKIDKELKNYNDN